MPKKILKVTCDTVASNQQTSTVRFFVPLPEDKNVKLQPGQQQIRAKSVVQITFADPKEGKEFEPGKSYTVTVE